MFKKIERQLEKAVEGTFGRAFKASVQPVELAHKLAKEMEQLGITLGGPYCSTTISGAFTWESH